MDSRWEFTPILSAENIGKKQQREDSIHPENVKFHYSIRSGKTRAVYLANNIPFDDRVNREADLADLNITLIQSYLKEAEL